ncbi:hypothetical protein GALMADRAFT_143199 [Galerina marginata CBS 339.88]|uniref:MARVEL domain-containing protein n=1 Tax=Galerina marginata (strain CBS 339.88) TaxID=685588 RepID=A0A067SQP2_GALM3|nr:hypothetical protein GALMADRAFT_143199 [Galerina marginata CBS 339.88]
MFRNRNQNGGPATTSNNDTLAGHRHRVARIVLSSLLLASALILLGLTARRIHFTRTFLGGSEGIVIELLITSIITILISILLILSLVRTSNIGFMRKFIELGFLLLIWLMSLVGAAIASHHWSENNECGGFFVFNECRLVQAIQAFSWIVLVLTSILVILRLVNWRRDNENPSPGYYNGQGKHATGAIPASNTGAVV